MVCELDLDRAVVEEFGGSFALDLVTFVAPGPTEADRVAGVFDFEAGFQCAKGDFAVLRGDRQRRRAAQISAEINNLEYWPRSCARGRRWLSQLRIGSPCPNRPLCRGPAPSVLR